MSERVRARKEARERERRAKGLPEPESSEQSDRGRDTATLSPRAASGSSALPRNDSLSLFGGPSDQSSSFAYNLPSLPFNIPVSPESSFPDFSSHMESNLFKGSSGPSASSFNNMFSMFASPTDTSDQRPPPTAHHTGLDHRSPPTPPLSAPGSGGSPGQPDLLTRLKSCCHLSDSHVVNDPGLLIFATRLCQSFPCAFNGAHPDSAYGSDNEHLLLEDSWKALKMQLDPGGEADGENRINTGRMAAELVCRAAATRGSGGGWIICRYREGLSIKRHLIAGLVQGLGGSLEN
ncbi:hypothetical protein BD324DRAFT_620899 [Kockovaella imperatae]|uniref:Uncharacterized protein n=1 Tax=Kockovaella imperatae TaxID=4999 RepID=A0A1Y1UK69_9TREE|nr:hypothetical protein BD324DRAFT_620899 [Kockovaella imperatae]ORX38448.1 hypothetical protein BD324DRAFT_620899 [Kockovaella imperatae]